MRRVQRKSNGGFSLIELLVVIGVIAFLTALVAMVVPGVISSAKAARTRATIKKVDELLTKRLEAITRDIQKQEAEALGTPPEYRAGFVSLPLERARVIGKKDFVKRNCPQQITDSSSFFAASPEYASNSVSLADSAECLYYFLTHGRQFGAEAPDADAFSASELGDTDHDGLLEILDGWGNPLRYYRWPTRLLRPADAGSESTHQAITVANEYDLKLRPGFTGVPGQSARILISSISLPTGSITTFADEATQPLAMDPDDPLRLTHPADSSAATTFEDTFHTPETFFIPLIVSAGQDGQLGLFEPNDTANHGNLCQPDLSTEGQQAILDNLTNQQPQK